ncbi:hypothetical protein [Micromonospora carbonacea]|uniref:Uncharacterized protein n=1 Tax=Micromonospora carbonacea TaxID=47853 RepID=A0A7H8XPW8_9ACTN|nr:hypothetical protein [Micromonospora carbonacea]MBB5825024.1 hypothetical protein [Micromonospora carbonacea]QLD26865.1 hypothetical protein HXZ27_23790 [Micromonospora carbonacea]
MAHGEAEPGCAQGESGRPGHHEPAAKHPRRLTGPPHPAEPACGRAAEPNYGRAAEAPYGWAAEPTCGRGAAPADEDAPVPRQRAAEPPADDESGRAGACRSDLPGWAGAHRHGPVRPRHRALRRERPPRRWC